MKHLISSVTIGACLLVSSAGDVFATNAHSGPALGAGQSGTGGTGVAGCGGTTADLTQPSPPGQVGNPNTNSPFPTGLTPPTPNYAGAGKGNYGAGNSGVPNPHANSQYDNACFQQTP
jgi:hypothetical protein